MKKKELTFKVIIDADGIDEMLANEIMEELLELIVNRFELDAQGEMPRKFAQATADCSCGWTVTAKQSEVKKLAEAHKATHAPAAPENVVWSCPLCDVSMNLPKRQTRFWSQGHLLKAHGRAMVATCEECARSFDLLEADQAEEWTSGHDCEASA